MIHEWQIAEVKGEGEEKNVFRISRYLPEVDGCVYVKIENVFFFKKNECRG